MTGSGRPPIAVVEDDENDVVLLQRAFRKCGTQNPLVFLPDGEAGRDYLSGVDGTPPALLLLDLKLPRLSGLELLEWMRAQPRLDPLPVVVLTSSRESADLEKAYALGANSYLVKPVAFEELLELVTAIERYWLELNEAPAPQELR